MLSFLLRFLLPAALAFGGGAFAAHRWDAGAIEALKLAQAKADATTLATRLAVVEAQDRVSLAAALNEARAQQKLADEKTLIPHEVRIHVSKAIDRSTCVSYGLVRVLDAAALGADPAALALPAGQSDGACAPVAASALATAVAENYVSASQNAEQLNALEAWVAAEDAASDSAH
jgi:hypothetical protein